MHSSTEHTTMYRLCGLSRGECARLRIVRLIAVSQNWRSRAGKPEHLLVLCRRHRQCNGGGATHEPSTICPRIIDRTLKRNELWCAELASEMVVPRVGCGGLLCAGVLRGTLEPLEQVHFDFASNRLMRKKVILALLVCCTIAAVRSTREDSSSTYTGPQQPSTRTDDNSSCGRSRPMPAHRSNGMSRSSAVVRRKPFFADLGRCLLHCASHLARDVSTRAGRDEHRATPGVAPHHANRRGRRPHPCPLE